MPCILQHPGPSFQDGAQILWRSQNHPSESFGSKQVMIQDGIVTGWYEPKR
jgi:hypothetical protein